MEQARRDFSAGRLTAVTLVRVPMTKSEWTVRLSGARGDAGMLLQVQTLQPQIFASLDKAVQAIEHIGFAFDQLKAQ
jgi:GTP cyclohydrolase III